MARKSTSTHRRATSLSATSPSPSSTDSSPDTLGTPSPETAAPAPPDQDVPVSSPEIADAAVTGAPWLLGEDPSRASATHAQLVALVEAVDTYTGRGGSWDNVLYQVEEAKLLLYPAGG